MLQIWKGSWAGPILLRTPYALWHWMYFSSNNESLSLLDNPPPQSTSFRCFMAQTVGQLGESREFDLMDLTFLKRDIRILKFPQCLIGMGH
jgi:hypothetical protein